MQKFVTYREENGSTSAPPTLVIPVVNPNGTIKYCRANRMAKSPIVEVHEDEDDQGNVLRRSVHLRPGFADRGWSLLADDFRADNAERAWDKFREWMKRGPMCTPGGQVAPWPDKYLPSSVIERRSGKAGHLLPPEEIVIPELDERRAAGDRRMEAEG